MIHHLHRAQVVRTPPAQAREFFVDSENLNGITPAIGPCCFYYHKHFFESMKGGVKMSNIVSHAMPFGPLGMLVHWLWFQRRLAGIFDCWPEKIAALFGET